MELKLFKEDDSSIEVSAGVLGDITLFIKDSDDSIEVERYLSDDEVDGLIKMLQLAKAHRGENE